MKRTALALLAIACGSPPVESFVAEPSAVQAVVAIDAGALDANAAQGGSASGYSVTVHDAAIDAAPEVEVDGAVFMCGIWHHPPFLGTIFCAQREVPIEPVVEDAGPDVAPLPGRGRNR